jgi:hypothetical protein
MDAQELRQRFVLANAFKEGDLSVGGTRDDRVRERRDAPFSPHGSERSDKRRSSRTVSASGWLAR